MAAACLVPGELLRPPIRDWHVPCEMGRLEVTHGPG
jgi:hypothetical protein